MHGWEWPKNQKRETGRQAEREKDRKRPREKILEKMGHTELILPLTMNHHFHIFCFSLMTLPSETGGFSLTSIPVCDASSLSLLEKLKTDETKFSSQGPNATLV